MFGIKRNKSPKLPKSSPLLELGWYEEQMANRTPLERILLPEPTLFEYWLFKIEETEALNKDKNG